MNTSRLSTELAGAGARWESRMPFNLLVAYEDQTTRDRALHLSQRLSQQLGEEYDFHCSWWKFEHLANETLHEQAARAAVEANMIVVALRARPTMSALQNRWINTWIPRRSAATGKAALVALVAKPETTSDGPAEAMTMHLRRLARAGRLDFFAHAFELPNPEPAEVEDEGPEEAPASNEHDQHFFKMPIPRWGINE